MQSRTFVILFLLFISFFTFELKGQSKYQKMLEVSNEGGPLISNG